MKQRLLFLSLLLLLMGGSFKGWGQATLPFNYDGGRPTSVTGLTHTGLGTDYASSPKMKFDTQDDNLILNFTGDPGTLSFAIKWNQSTAAARFPGDFELLESADGITYTRVQLYNSTTGTALTNGTVVTETFTTLISTTRYLKWTYTTKTNGNIAIGAITLGAAAGTPIIILTPLALTGFTYIQGSGPSTEQTFTVSGSNLTANISIAASTNYEISKTSGSGYASPLTFTPSGGGTVSETTVYVRLKAGLSAGTYNSEVITASSTDANNKTVTCSGKVLSPEPTTAASTLSFTSVTATGFTINWTNGNGSNRLVLMKSGSAVDADPVDGTSYTANTAFGSGTQIGTGNYVVYNSTGSSVTVTGLTSSTTYHVELFEFNGSGGTENYLTSSSISGNQQTNTIPLGWQISSVNTPFVIDFDNTVEGVNNGQFTGTGFTASPSAGQLNSNSFAITGWADGDLSFGATRNTASTDFTRGTSTGGVTTGGNYAFTVSTNNNAFGFQPGSGDWAPGTLTLKFQNQSGVSITDIHVSYLVYVRNDQGRSSNFNFSHSSDNSSYTAISDIDLTSGEVADGTPSWKSMRRILKLSGLNLSNGSFYYFKWSGSDVGGSGSRDEFALDDITIVANPTSNLSISGTFSELVLSSTAASLVQKSNTLTISGTLTNNAGASGLVIESDATGTGSLIHSSNGVAATVERYIPGVSYAWHLLGAPVAAQDISGDWIAGNYDFYSWDEAQALWLNQKVGANNLTSFTPGKGYLVAYETAALTKSFSGNLNNGDVVVAVTKDGAGGSNGANLLANPYPSGIDWNTATKTLFADNFAYVYDQTANGGAGAFVSIDGSANNAWIAPHQGFFVVAQTAGNFTFTNAMREHGGTYTKNTTGIEDELAIRLSGETWFDVSRIRIREGSTSQRDRNDALHFSSFTADAPQLYTLSEDGKQLSINALPAISQETAISLGSITPIEGAYSISVETLNGQFADKTIYLEDKLLNVQHNLTSNGAYSFIGTPADSPTRFLLHFGAVGVSEQPESSALKAYVVGGQLYFPLQGEAILQIVDLQGRVLQQSHVAGQGLTSTALQQPAGAYVVRLMGSHSVQTAKVIVK